ncbi:MAG TPA: hypothetical protein VN132_03840, partial [Bdellovibrio sp.]|nr:hypothetical protein [Bdellovibrio sp.]
MKNRVILILALLIWSFIATSSAHALDLFTYNPPKTVMDGIQLPRNYRILYRGLPEVQFSAGKAVAAMLGNSEATLESPVFYLITSTLNGGDFNRTIGAFNALDRPDIDGLELFPAIQREQKKLTQQYKIGSIPYSVRLQVAEKILDEAFGKFNIEQRYLTYVQNPQRVDFPGALIYSSTYVDVAKIYSPHIVIFDESEKPRSLDLNFYNYVHDRKWIGTVNNQHPDRGEFLTPYYIPAEQIIGYQYARANFDPNWIIWHPLTADLGVVFMKSKIQNENIVLVFDGTGLQNIERDQKKEDFCSSLTVFDPRLDLAHWPNLNCAVKPKLIGAMKICSLSTIKNGKCQMKELADLF